MTISVSVAPRPPNSRGQSIPTYPASYILFCHHRSLTNSSRFPRDAANDLPRRSSGRLRSSHERTSFRKLSSLSENSKFIGRQLRAKRASQALPARNAVPVRRPREIAGRREGSRCEAPRSGPTEAYSCTPQGVPRRGNEADGPLSSARRQPVAGSPRDASSVDVERLAGDVARLVGREKERRVADVVGGLLAFHGDDVGHALLEHLTRANAGKGGIGGRDVRGELLPERRPQHAGTDRVHGDAVGRELLRHD